MNKPNINFFGVGAAKSGTTSIYNYLKQHSEVFLPKVKEPNYYSDIESEDPLVYNPPKEGVFYHNKIINDKNIYFSLYKNSVGYKAIGDCSPSYLWDKNASKKIYKDYPNAKIIIILRDPIIRTFSHYLMNLKNGVETDTDFLEALKRDEKTYPKIWGDGKVLLYKELSLYHNQVKRFFDTFKKENVKVIMYEDFFSNIENGLLNLFEFLEINFDHNINFNEIHNKYSVPKNSFFKYFIQKKKKFGFARKLIPEELKNHLNKKILYKEGSKPELTIEAKKYLSSIFYEDVKKLESLTDFNFNNWL